MQTTRWVCRLDKKRRFVLPCLAREQLGISEYALVELGDGKLVVTSEKGERKQARPISRNLYEVIA